MICAKCNVSKTEVTRTVVLPGATQRERKCVCGARFLTAETVIIILPDASPQASKPENATRSNATGNTQVTTRQRPGTGSEHKSSQVSDPNLTLIRSEPDQASSKPSDARAMEPPVFKGMALARKGDTWDVPADLHRKFAASFPAVNLLTEYAKISAWLDVNPVKRKTARGMGAFLMRWLGIAQDRGGSMTQTVGKVKPWIAAERAEEERRSKQRFDAATARDQVQEELARERERLKAGGSL